MLPSEIQRIESKKREWDKGLRDFWDFINRCWSEIKLDMKKIIDWYWFDRSKGSGEKALHIIVWWLITLAILRIFRFI